MNVLELLKTNLELTMKGKIKTYFIERDGVPYVTLKGQLTGVEYLAPFLQPHDISEVEFILKRNLQLNKNLYCYVVRGNDYGSEVAVLLAKERCELLYHGPVEPEVLILDDNNYEV